MQKYYPVLDTGSVQNGKKRAPHLRETLLWSVCFYIIRDELQKNSTHGLVVLFTRYSEIFFDFLWDSHAEKVHLITGVIDGFFHEAPPEFLIIIPYVDTKRKDVDTKRKVGLRAGEPQPLSEQAGSLFVGVGCG
ncbi:MAG: hypothetical protein ACOX65_01765 [Anaerotruncus rubiinfantis]